MTETAPNRNAILKVPGITPDQLHGIHRLFSRESDKVNPCKVLAAKFDLDFNTYTIEVLIPIDGMVNKDVHWRLNRSTLEDIVDVLEIFKP